jgi:hypothetical protein
MSREPNATCVKLLEDLLEQARAGEVQVIVVAKQHHDGTGSWIVGGLVGSYSLLGALHRAAHYMLGITDDGA